MGTKEDAFDALYRSSVPAKRTGALFSAFPYPTKISPEAIALYIAAHTKPGDVVLDVFGGSGTTGLAALLCSQPPSSLVAEAARLGIDARWGARSAILYEIGALGSFISRTLTEPPNPTQFATAAEDLLSSVQTELGWMYAAVDADGRPGELRHTVWSEDIRCPVCKSEASLWQSTVSLKPANISSDFRCPHCSSTSNVSEAERVEIETFDQLLNESRLMRRRRPAWVYGRTGASGWSRPANASDQKLIEKIANVPIPKVVPIAQIPWGDLYRRGYHQGITHLHHFYSRRNLIVFGTLWQKVEQFAPAIQDSLRFWLLSYNASHSTLMTRVVAKKGHDDLAVTSNQPGVLYISGLPVEKNLFSGLRRKLKHIREAFDIASGLRGTVTVVNASSTNLDINDASIDYVFTDPPFGGNIPYAEVNYLNEAWLGRLTQTKDEIVVSPSQRKGLSHYQALMNEVFVEVHRVLKDEGRATVIFHSASAAVWNALRSAYKSAGFHVERASVLDKLQGSFKQVTTTGAVKGDPALLLTKIVPAEAASINVDWTLVADNLVHRSTAMSDPSERSPQRLYSRLVAHFLTRHQAVPIDADSFYRWHARLSGKDGARTDESNHSSATANG